MPNKRIKRNERFYKQFQKSRKYVLYPGEALELLKSLPSNSIDLTFTSPPYCIGKEYEKETSVEEFEKFHQEILSEIVRVTKDGGSICWQVGYHVNDSIVFPLDYAVHAIMSKFEGIFLRNRIVWAYGHGLHCIRRFSGRHEVILWYTKGSNYYFNLDDVRVPQKYPGKTFYKGKRKGQFSGNPLGKNPSDMWEIPNVNANHIEKTIHPCQFPVALAQRMIRGLSRKRGRVLDPFMGSGTTGVAAILDGRRFVGSETKMKYFRVAETRCLHALRKQLKHRPLEKPIYQPDPKTRVAQNPFLKNSYALKIEKRDFQKH
ncbi:MAG: Methyltransferase [Pedosphaera sp.]|nr:Methyltransferase [Pedosphaera sp.]